MGLWTPLRPTTAGSLGLFSSFWSFASTVPSLSLPFPLSCFLSYILPFSAFHTFSPSFSFSLALPHYFLLLPPIYLLLVFTLWVQVLSCVSHCLHFPKSFLVLVNSLPPQFPIIFPILPSLLYLFSVSFPFSFYYSLFLLFLPVLLPSFFLSHI